MKIGQKNHSGILTDELSNFEEDDYESKLLRLKKAR